MREQKLINNLEQKKKGKKEHKYYEIRNDEKGRTKNRKTTTKNKE